MTDRRPSPWLADLAPAPPPFEVSRPDAEVLVACIRSGVVAAVVLAAIPSLAVVPFVLAFGPAWAAPVAWGVTTALLTRWIRGGIWFTLTPHALSIRHGRAVPTVVPWALVDRVEIRRDPFRMDEPVVNSMGNQVTEGQRSPRLTVSIRRGAVGLNAGDIDLVGGLNELALDWLYRAVDSAWRSARRVE